MLPVSVFENDAFQLLLASYYADYGEEMLQIACQISISVMHFSQAWIIMKCSVFFFGLVPYNMSAKKGTEKW